jgi:hypothetical protein
MANTPNYGLLKPDRTDNINDVDTSLANNFTTIDLEIKNRKDEIDGHIAGTNGQHTSEVITHADGNVKTTLENHETRLGNAETELTDHEGRLTDIETLGLDLLGPDVENRIATLESDVEGFLAPATFDSMNQQSYTFDEYRIGYVNNALVPINEQLADSASKMQTESINVLFPPNKNEAAIADGVTFTTAQLNNLLSKYRGQKIFFPDGVYMIDNSLIVFDNTVIQLGKNAVVKFKANMSRVSPNAWSGIHMFKNDLTNGLKNIEIYGGMIDGQGTTQPTDMHRGFRFEGVDGLKIHDVKIKEVAGWGLTHVACKNFHFYNIEFDQAPYSKYGYNSDGITGTSTDGVIENVFGYTGDDMVAFNAGNSLFATKNDISNVVIRNIFPKAKTWTDTDGSTKVDITHRAVALYASGGYKLDNIVVDTVQGVSRFGIKLEKFSSETGIGYAGKITYRDIDLKVGIPNVATSDEAFLVNDITCTEIVLDNVKLRDIQGTTGFVKYGINIQNAPVDTLKISGLTVNITEGSNQVINDSGSIKSLRLNDIEANFQGASQGHLYYKGSTDSNITVIRGQNIRGNAIYHVQRAATAANIRIDSFDLKLSESKLQLANQSENDRVFTVEKGLGVVKVGAIAYFAGTGGIRSISSGWTNYNISFASAQSDTSYGVVIGTEWDSGNTWITNKTTTGFTVNWKTAPASSTSLAYRIVR